MHSNIQPSDSSPFHKLSNFDTNDNFLHPRNIEKLAREMNLSVQEIQPLYDAILTHLEDEAKVKNYLPILVLKKVKIILNTKNR